MLAHTFHPGDHSFFAIDSPDKQRSAVFEDDGDTGYFYAVEFERSKQKIVDAVQIYSRKNVVDRERASSLSIIWSRDNMKCAILINDYPHAAFDFQARRGFCRTNFPNSPDDPRRNWRKSDHAWSDDAIHWLNGDPS